MKRGAENITGTMVATSVSPIPKTEKARLDSAGTAKGKTEIVFHAKKDDCIPYAGSIGPLEYREVKKLSLKERVDLASDRLDSEQSPETVRSPESATDRKVWVLSKETAYREDHQTLNVFLSEESASKEKERLEAEQAKRTEKLQELDYFSIVEVALQK